MPHALLFDLFGTVVQFQPQVPTVEVAGAPWRTTMGWLRDTAERALPAVSFDDLLPALMQVTEDIVRQRPPEYFEVPSRERFRRTRRSLRKRCAASAPQLPTRSSSATALATTCVARAMPAYPWCG